jgi:hypothetical protein
MPWEATIGYCPGCNRTWWLQQTWQTGGSTAPKVLNGAVNTTAAICAAVIVKNAITECGLSYQEVLGEGAISGIPWRYFGKDGN